MRSNVDDVYIFRRRCFDKYVNKTLFFANAKWSLTQLIELAAEAATAANEDQLNESSSSFKHKQTKYRSLKKADQALPNSPNKRKEIVQNLAKKYEIRINLNESTKGRKATLLTNEEEQWIVNALLLFLCCCLLKSLACSFFKLILYVFNA